MSYTTLLFDNDNTIMDFSAAERAALKKAFLKFNIALTDEQVKHYSAINDKCWKLFEKGIITKPTVLKRRFEEFLAEQKIDLLSSEIAPVYEEALSYEHFVFEGARELLEQLRKNFDLYLITNGAGPIQKRRLKDSKIGELFLKVFISEEIGFCKPQREYFDAVLGAINETDKSKVLIIGDSLSSDILGGINCGVDTCLFNPFSKPDFADFAIPKFIARSYDDIKRILNI